jgi:hypothetical protein
VVVFLSDEASSATPIISSTIRDCGFESALVVVREASQLESALGKSLDSRLAVAVYDRYPTNEMRLLVSNFLALRKECLILRRPFMPWAASTREVEQIVTEYRNGDDLRARVIAWLKTFDEPGISLRCSRTRGHSGYLVQLSRKLEARLGKWISGIATN